MVKRLIGMFAIVVLSMCATACSSDPTIGFASESKKYAEDGVNFSAEGGTVNIKFVHPSDTDLTVEVLSGSTSTWINVVVASQSSTSTTFTVGASNNSTGKERSGIVAIRDGSDTWTVTVTQSAS